MKFCIQWWVPDPQPPKSTWTLSDDLECPWNRIPPLPSKTPDHAQKWGCFPWGHLFWLPNQPKFQGVLIPTELLPSGRLSPAENPGSGSPSSLAEEFCKGRQSFRNAKQAHPQSLRPWQQSRGLWSKIPATSAKARDGQWKGGSHQCWYCQQLS